MTVELSPADIRAIARIFVAIDERIAAENDNETRAPEPDDGEERGDHG
jgi:hypothetical protein